MNQNNQPQQPPENQPLIRNLPNEDLENLLMIFQMYDGANLSNQNVPDLHIHNAVFWTAFCAYTVGRLPWSLEGKVSVDFIVALYNRAVIELLQARR